jgi:putative ABC transport system substrate-binding protein
MKRRAFISALGGTMLLPRGAFAQSGRVPRVGFLSGLAADDPAAQDRVKALRDGLRKLGWVPGRNLAIEVTMAGGSDRLPAVASELVERNPDVIVAAATTALVAVKRLTTSIPIVFAQVTDPVGAGFVQSLARPGGNITGFTQHEFSVGLKWLELLKELTPRATEVTVLYDPHNPASAGYLKLLQSNADAFKVHLLEHSVREDSDVERALALTTQQNRGMVVLPGPGPSVRRDLIIKLAAQHRVPTVYPFRYWVTAGGLAFYGIDNIDLYRLAASYVDKILKGEKPADLPVQHSTKFELVLNLKTAKALGIEPPLALLARTDEVIE